jgi:hypothetical protein
VEHPLHLSGNAFSIRKRYLRNDAAGAKVANEATSKPCMTIKYGSSEGRQLIAPATKSANGRNMPNRHSMNRTSNKSGSVMC